jgi:riboflavin biosynthesis pyrimidine reductase
VFHRSRWDVTTYPGNRVVYDSQLAIPLPHDKARTGNSHSTESSILFSASHQLQTGELKRRKQLTERESVVGLLAAFVRQLRDRRSTAVGRVVAVNKVSALGGNDLADQLSHSNMLRVVELTSA